MISGKGGIYAKVVADSTANDIRLTTLELRYPRFIHSEFMTHRLFSRNASSSRAIPVEKMLEQVRTEPAIPIHWGRNQKGMQAKEEVSNAEASVAWEFWVDAAQDAIANADTLAYIGIHKQIINRLLEPFQFIKVIVTATEWDNFFKLRLHPDAQPEIQELARVMKAAMDGSKPAVLALGEWHLPYVTEFGRKETGYGQQSFCFNDSQARSHFYGDVKEAIKCSVARCARVSYLTHDKQQPDIKADMDLADRLLGAGHMSPFEHQASPMVCQTHSYNNRWKPLYTGESGITHVDRDGNYWSANLRGWLQYRQML